MMPPLQEKFLLIWKLLWGFSKMCPWENAVKHVSRSIQCVQRAGTSGRPGPAISPPRKAVHKVRLNLWGVPLGLVGAPVPGPGTYQALVRIK